jgi:alkylation response protein AidB-like acyl-CoA dehydrogenase
MDFAFNTEQQDVRDLAARILGDFCTPERLPDFEKAGDRFDRGLWSALADASLLGVALPTDVGGMGLGFLELCVLLEQAGRFVAPVPLFPSLVLGAAPIAHFGSTDQRSRHLGPVVAGTSVLTAALTDAGSRDPQAPATTAVEDGGVWVLDGEKVCVLAASIADAILVPATVADGRVVVALVARDAQGLTLEPEVLTTGETVCTIRLEGVRVGGEDLLGGPQAGADVLRWTVERATAALCAVALGNAERALRLTAKYTGERKQFGKAIATFQAVAQRAADAYIDVEAMRVTTWQAAWRLSQGLPAVREVAIAKSWACEGGHRVCYAAQHLHGGIGVDKDYPLHRHYLLSKQAEILLGASNEQLARLGGMLAANG